MLSASRAFRAQPRTARSSPEDGRRGRQSSSRRAPSRNKCGTSRAGHVSSAACVPLSAFGAAQSGHVASLVRKVAEDLQERGGVLRAAKGDLVIEDEVRDDRYLVLVLQGALLLEHERARGRRRGALEQPPHGRLSHARVDGHAQQLAAVPYVALLLEVC